MAACGGLQFADPRRAPLLRGLMSTDLFTHQHYARAHINTRAGAEGDAETCAIRRQL